MNDHNAKVAIFWDDSYLWGLIAYRTFMRLGIDFTLLRGGDIRQGQLAGYDILFVPGGWASDKIESLGEDGAAGIRRFVEDGGSYLGFCGGAGLALSHESGLGLAPFGRVPTSARLPSFSGRVELVHDDPGHSMWRGIPDGVGFCAWWPGQFAIEPGAGALVLASYGSPGSGAFVTDLPVVSGEDWKKWEKLYGINLDPARITGEPAVVEVAYGRGRVLLSYLHFETPEDGTGHEVLLNLIEYLSGERAATGMGPSAEESVITQTGDDTPTSLTADLLKSFGDFIRFGEQNFLWYWRSPWLLQWRRGVKGIEYSTLYGMLAELDRLVGRFGGPAGESNSVDLKELQAMVGSFITGARDLIMNERYALSQGPISPLKSEDPRISELRERLFSSRKRCGGLYREILEAADSLLLPLLKRESEERKR